MNDIQIFNNPEFGEIRTVMIDGEPWFEGKYLCKVLGYARPENVVKERTDEEDRLYIDEKLILKMGLSFDYKALGQRGGWVVNESGMYSLIFGSKLESAKKFKKWVTSEVLPSIRKTGTYGQQKLPQTTAEKIALLAQGHTELNERVGVLEERFDKFQTELPLMPDAADDVSNAVKKRGVQLLGGKESKAYNNRGLRQKVYNNLYANLKYNFNVKRYKQIKNQQKEEALKIIKKYELPYFLRNEIENENSNSNNL